MYCFTLQKIVFSVVEGMLCKITANLYFMSLVKNSSENSSPSSCARASLSEEKNLHTVHCCWAEFLRWTLFRVIYIFVNQLWNGSWFLVLNVKGKYRNFVTVAGLCCLCSCSSTQIVKFSICFYFFQFQHTKQHRNLS